MRHAIGHSQCDAVAQPDGEARVPSPSSSSPSVPCPSRSTNGKVRPHVAIELDRLLLSPSTVPTASVPLETCGEHEIEIVPQLLSSSRYCRVPFDGLDYNTSILEVNARLDYAQGQASVVERMVKQVDGTYSTTALLATSVASGQLLASTSVANSHAKSNLGTKLEDAALITGAIETSHVYHDQLRIYMSFQLRDAISFNVNTNPASVSVQVARLASKEVVVSRTLNCGGSGTDGICHGYVSLPDDYCNTLAADDVLEVGYQLSSTGAAETFTWFGENVIAVARPSSVTDEVIDTMFVEVPSFELVAGESFEIKIKSRFLYYLSNAGLKFTVGGELSLSTIQLSSNFKTASFDVNADANEVTALFAGRKDSQPVEQQPSPTDEVLLTATVTVGSTAADGEKGLLQVTLLQDLTNQQNAQLTPSSTYGYGAIYSREGLVYGGSASVHFRENTFVGIFAAAGVTELLNTAAVSGNTLKTDIVVKGVRLRQDVEVTQQWHHVQLE